MLSSVDVAPTILEVLGVEPPDGWVGHGFLAEMEWDGPSRFREHLVLEGGHGHEISVRTPDWAYREILPEYRDRTLRYLGYRPEHPYELFDLTVDPEERVDVYDPGRREVAQAREILRVFLAAKASAAPALDSDDHLEALRALGYVN